MEAQTNDDVKSAGYEILINLLTEYTDYINDYYINGEIDSVHFSEIADEFILAEPSTIDTFFQRVKSMYNCR